jgi:hypothetical protein
MYGMNDNSSLRAYGLFFQSCREKNVTLNAEKLQLGLDVVEFVGYI